MTETLQAVLRGLADRDVPGLLAGDRRWTWREYVAGASARANVVRGWLDPGRPPHVGLLFANTPEMAFGLAASALAGYVSVGLNLTRRGTALAQDVLRADCQVLLTDAEHRAEAERLELPGVRVVDTDGPEWASAVLRAERTVRDPREVDPADTFMLIFTSGTSGAPKAVRVGNQQVVWSGNMLAERFSLTPDDVCYSAMPLFHSNAIMAGYGPAVCSGAAMALAPRFSASNFLPDVRRYGATYMNYVGKPLSYVLRTPRQPDDADNPLRNAFGNEAFDRDIADFSERFDCVVWDGFGSTELGIVITRVPETPPGSIGVPFDGVKVYDRATRTECPPAVFDATGRVTNLDAAVGELVNTQGGFFFSGYYNDDEATAARMDGGMYWSGDLGYRDQAGFVYLAGRTSDWLRVDGENLGAGIIEQILLRHAGINRVAVYGVPAPDVGDQLVAAIVLNPDSGLTPETFEAFLAAQEDLSPKGWPRYVRIAEDLPATATNKVLKRELISQGTVFADPRWVRDERGTRYTKPAPVPSGGE